MKVGKPKQKCVFKLTIFISKFITKHKNYTTHMQLEIKLKLNIINSEEYF